MCSSLTCMYGSVIKFVFGFSYLHADGIYREIQGEEITQGRGRARRLNAVAAYLFGAVELEGSCLAMGRNSNFRGGGGGSASAGGGSSSRIFAFFNL